MFRAGAPVTRRIRSPGSWSAALRLIGAIALLPVATACGPAQNPAGKPSVVSACANPQPLGEAALPGGTFTLGAKPDHADEGPPHDVTVGPFSIDRTEVTNAQFAEFVEATGYVTLAERKPDPVLYPGAPPEQLKPAAIVFVGAESLSDGDPSGWWRLIEGANWRHPEGPKSDIKDRARHPVVEVAYQDALAYAQWRGRDLPTEAEWEYAARAGLQNARYEWGDAAPSKTAPQANTWQGVFPAIDSGDDGYKARTAPVGCYAPSAYGLYDMTGNVWEWTKDWYPDGRKPSDPERQHLVKGGSYLCADNFCARYRPSARQGGPPDTGSSHIGFRTILRGAKS